jgi:hypothetical protein
LASAADAYTVLKTVNANVTGIQLLVSIGDVLVWAVIDDSQSANWQNINNTQAVVWSAISDTQTPSWVQITNTQASGWQDVDDTQTPGWNDLPS